MSFLFCLLYFVFYLCNCLLSLSLCLILLLLSMSLFLFHKSRSGTKWESLRWSNLQFSFVFYLFSLPLLLSYMSLFFFHDPIFSLVLSFVFCLLSFFFFLLSFVFCLCHCLLSFVFCLCQCLLSFGFIVSLFFFHKTKVGQSEKAWDDPICRRETIKTLKSRDHFVKQNNREMDARKKEKLHIILSFVFLGSSKTFAWHKCCESKATKNFW